jgi:hypothetical protein
LRRSWISLIAVLCIAAVPAAATAAPVDSGLTLSGAARSSTLSAEGGSGYNAKCGACVVRRSYTVRLVASSQANVENLRGDVEAAAAQIRSINGVNLAVAPGTIAERSPQFGEILVYTKALSGSTGAASWWTTSQIGNLTAMDSGTVTIAAPVTNLSGYNAARRRNTVLHEFGHVMGLEHYDAEYGGTVQVMNTYQTELTSYQTGDLIGLAYMGRIPNSDGDAFNDFDDWCPTRSGVASNHGCQPEGQQSSSGVYRENIDGVNMFYPQTNGVLALEHMDANLPGQWVFDQFPGTAVVGRVSAIHRSNGDVMAIYKSTDSRIHITWLNHANNTWATTGAMSSPLAGPPTAVERNNGNVHVIYKGTDGALHDLWLGGTTWSDQWLGGSPAGNPQVMARSNNGDIHIFYRSTGGPIYDLWLSGSSWNNQYLGGFPAGDPYPLYRPDNTDVHVFYKASDGAIWDLWLGGSSWHNQLLGGSPAGPISPVYSTKTGDLHALYRSTSGNIRDLWMNASTNGWSDNLVAEGAAGAPSAVNRTKTGDLHVFFVSPQGNLFDAVKDPLSSSWSSKLLRSGAVATE